MAEIFKDKIQYKLVTVTRAQDLAACNFKLCPPVEYLDLSRNDNLLRNMHLSSFQAVFTKEGFQNRIIPERKILYEFHLDLPRHLENIYSGNRTEVVSGRVFHLKGVSVLNTVYKRDLERYIVSNIRNASEKIEKLRSYMNTLQLLDFGENDNTTIYLCDYVLRMLNRENCTDSELVRNFLTLFDFTAWLSRRERPRVLEYVLLQGQKARYTNDLFQFLDPRWGPVNYCFFSHKIRNMRLLIKYGNIASIPTEFIFNENLRANLLRPVHLGILSYPRAFRVFQLLFGFLFHRQYPQGLRCIWRSVKDPFLNTVEIDAILRPFIPSDTVEALHFYHVNYIIGKNNGSSEPVPRTLKDMCRVDVRRYLNYNHQVPSGISALDIPEELKSFLKLKK